MTNTTKPHGKKYFCLYAYNTFLASCKTFLAIIQNQNYFLKKIIKRLIKAPSIIYGDFECVLSPSADNTDVGSNTKKYQDYVFCSYHYRLICVHKRYSKPYKTYFDEAAN